MLVSGRGQKDEFTEEANIVWEMSKYDTVSEKYTEGYLSCINPLVFRINLIPFHITNIHEWKLELSYLITIWEQPNLYFCRNKMTATHFLVWFHGS